MPKIVPIRRFTLLDNIEKLTGELNPTVNPINNNERAKNRRSIDALIPSKATARVKVTNIKSVLSLNLSVNIPAGNCIKPYAMLVIDSRNPT